MRATILGSTSASRWSDLHGPILGADEDRAPIRRGAMMRRPVSFMAMRILFAAVALAGSPSVAMGQRSKICDLLPRAEVELASGRKVHSHDYVEPRVGGRICTYQLQPKPADLTAGANTIRMVVAYYDNPSPKPAKEPHQWVHQQCSGRGGPHLLEAGQDTAFTCADDVSASNRRLSG